MKKKNIDNNYFKKKSKFLSRLIIFIIIAIVLAAGFIFTKRLINKYNKSHVTINTIENFWKQEKYTEVYDSCKLLLQEQAFNNKVLTYYSYASFILAVSQTDSSLAQTYLDEAINNLRIVMYDAKPSLIPQLEYMLGKAYFYKNTISTYYYADLAVKFLTKAREDGYEADDIPEYLGLSYAVLGMTKESISSFTEALLFRESDSLLLSIAEQYYKCGETSAAKQYLFRVINNSDNDEIVIKCRNLLGNIYIEQKEYSEALEEFRNVLALNQKSADAHYGIGLVYESQGNMVMARAEWREALKIQVNHPGALKKFSETR